MPRKQPKTDNCWLSKSVSISNSIDRFEEVFNDINNYKKVEKTVKFFSKLLEEIAISDYGIKIINNKQVIMQPKSSIVYINIVKELKSKDTEFHMYEPR